MLIGRFSPISTPAFYVGSAVGGFVVMVFWIGCYVSRERIFFGGVTGRGRCWPGGIRVNPCLGVAISWTGGC